MQVTPGRRTLVGAHSEGWVTHLPANPLDPSTLVGNSVLIYENSWDMVSSIFTSPASYYDVGQIASSKQMILELPQAFRKPWLQISTLKRGMGATDFYKFRLPVE